LLHGCYKNPFPGLRLAVGIFGSYLLIEGLLKTIYGILSSY